MPVYISYNHRGEVTSVIAAKSEDLAKAYWHGANVDVHTHKNLSNPEDFIPPNEHPTGVLPILVMEEVTVSRWDINSELTYLKQKR